MVCRPVFPELSNVWEALVTIQTCHTDFLFVLVYQMIPHRKAVWDVSMTDHTVLLTALFHVWHRLNIVIRQRIRMQPDVMQIEIPLGEQHALAVQALVLNAFRMVHG